MKDVCYPGTMCSQHLLLTCGSNSILHDVPGIKSKKIKEDTEEMGMWKFCQMGR